MHFVIDSPMTGWTNTVERSISLTDPDWEPIGGFMAPEIAFSWNCPVGTNTTAFYRVISRKIE